MCSISTTFNNYKNNVTFVSIVSPADPSIVGLIRQNLGIVLKGTASKTITTKFSPIIGGVINNNNIEWDPHLLVAK